MNLVLVNQFFNLARALVCDGFTVSLSNYFSQVSPDYDNISIVITIKSDERLIKKVENRILVSLGGDYKITRTNGKEFTNLSVSIL